jgi:biotin transport system substrate-specific component
MAQAITTNIGTRTAASVWLWRGGIALTGSIFLALCSHVTLPLPWTPVPLNLQPFGVILLALLLGPGLAAATALLYLVEGAAGAPVFSPHGPGGLLQLMGPTGGYLLSYPIAAWVTGKLAGTREPRTLSISTQSVGASDNVFARAVSFWRFLGASIAGDAFVLLAGTAWLAILTRAAARAVVTASLLPFLPGDFLKCVAAAAIAAGWFQWRSRRG